MWFELIPDCEGKARNIKRHIGHLDCLSNIDDESILSFVCFGSLHMKLQSSTILLLFSWEVSNPKKDHEMKPCHLFYWWTLAGCRLPLPPPFLPRFGLNWPKPSVRRCTAAGWFQGCPVDAGLCGKAKAIAAMTSWRGWEPQSGLVENYMRLILHIHLGKCEFQKQFLCATRKTWFDRIKLMIPMKWQEMINIKILIIILLYI